MGVCGLGFGLLDRSGNTPNSASLSKSTIVCFPLGIVTTRTKNPKKKKKNRDTKNNQVRLRQRVWERVLENI